ncbi:MAG TPA: hypothetical protein VMG12_35000 [Polyangiaceae bacterium]|nr:hypothetical protein [Polyangiaceae bacterium]
MPSRRAPTKSRESRRAEGRAYGLVGLLLAIAGCATPEPEPEMYELSIRVESDPGRPLAGATVLGAAQFRSESDATGVVRLRINGQQGQRLRFQVRCPEGYRAPEQPLDVTLTRLGADAPPPEYGVRCAPEVRTVVIAVRAQHGAGLPVKHLGREVARTDRAGAAHVVMQLAPHEPIELSIDTSSQPKLEPQNPTQRFEPPDTDAVLLFDAPFVTQKPRAKAGPARPTRI